MYSKLLELEKEQSKLNRLVQSIVTSDPQAPNNFEVLMPCVLSGQLVIDNGRKFTLTSYRYQCSTAQLFLPKKDLKYIQNNFKELKKTPDKQDKIFETIYDDILKQVDKYFSLYDINKFRSKLHDGKDKFLALENFGEKESKDKVITKILRGLHANAERTSLKEIGLSTPLGQFQSGEGGITLSDNTKIIYQSPTGLFERHVYLKDL